MTTKIQNESDFYKMLPYDRETFLRCHRIRLVDIRKKLRSRLVKNVEEPMRSKPSLAAIKQAINNYKGMEKLTRKVCIIVFDIYNEKISKNLNQTVNQ